MLSSLHSLDCLLFLFVCLLFTMYSVLFADKDTESEELNNLAKKQVKVEAYRCKSRLIILKLFFLDTIPYSLKYARHFQMVVNMGSYELWSLHLKDQQNCLGKQKVYIKRQITTRGICSHYSPCFKGEKRKNNSQ